MITLVSHPWAHGCMRCSYGVRDEYYQPPVGGVELVLERLIAAERVGPAYFCDCQAGQALRTHLDTVRERYHGRVDCRMDGVDYPIGDIILAAARATMAQPHYRFSQTKPEQVTR